MVENATEKDACYATIVARARDIFPTREEFGGFCNRIDTQWRTWCVDG